MTGYLKAGNSMLKSVCDSRGALIPAAVVPLKTLQQPLQTFANASKSAATRRAISIRCR
jgi:hypothetical protein